MKSQEFILPFSVVSVLAMLVFPVPAWLLDGLLAINLAFCVTLLLVSLFIIEPDRFTSLPSLLLLTTLFRLGLNISSTRTILGGESVPGIIISFGEFVVGGSAIIGLVVFAIISIIQFIVIAKGSERVAEVAARFTLDALPGKQMSIDADMRAGILSLEDARSKRKELHRESKLYGALDGAMKFIKGDAIVGICIIFVNISAGFLLGISRDGLSFVEALQTYTIFTIGDGLVSQIPAVLIAVAAGIVVTRVSDNDSSKLAGDISAQLSAEPVALIVSSLVLLSLGCIPGFPFFAFLFAGSIPLALAVKNLKAQQKNVSHSKHHPFSPRILPPVTIKMSVFSAQRLQSENMLHSYVEAIRAEMFDTKGVFIPEVAFDIEPIDQGFTAVILLHSRTAASISKTHLSTDDDWSQIIASGFRDVLKKHLHVLINDGHTRELLDIHEVSCKDAIHAILRERVTITTLTVILRSLVLEGLSIRDFAGILQGINEYYEEFVKKGVISLSTFYELSNVNAAIRNRILLEYLERTYNQSLEIKGVALPALIDSKLAEQLQAGLPPHPSLEKEIVEWLLTHETSTTIFCSRASRYAVAQLVISKNLDHSVLAYDEVPPSYNCQVSSESMEIDYEEAA